MEVEIKKTVEISKLQLKAGDVLVVKSERSLPREHLDKIKKDVSDYLPDGVKCLVIDRTLTLSTLTAEDIATRT